MLFLNLWFIVMKNNSKLRIKGYSLGLFLFLFIFFSCSRKVKHPNIVLIMADDLGYECLACNGGESYQTPELDKLAATGIRYTNCFSQPLCTPSRVEIMTGKYNNRNYTAFGILKTGELTFAHLFKEAGYVTGIAGKWQLFGSTSAGKLQGTGTFPTDAGFDEYCLWQIDKVGSRYADPLIHRNSNEAEVYEGEYGPDIFYRFIDEFLTRNKDKPFFLYYPMLPHDPHVPTPDSEDWETDRYKKDDRFFADMVRYMDKNVGKVADKLDELGLRNNTILIFTGDNGTNRRIVSMMNGEQIPGKKGMPVYYGTHVPLIINGGKMIKGGQIRDNLIDFTDFLPTLCRIAGIDMSPWKGDGKSFEKTFGKDKDLRDWIYCYYDSGKKHFPMAVFAQNKTYKLYRDGRFFNIEKDKKEIEWLDTINLAPSENKNRESLMKVLMNQK
jgi:arylsulfatase A-like enzyme